MSETYTAVLDRIVDEGTAVLLLESDGDVVDDLAVALEALPVAGRHEGAVFSVTVDREKGRLLEATYRAEAERKRQESIQDRFDRLSERLSDRDEK
ncbi:DUF3006 domain-containing protein [Natrinema limicola]|uniref:DUF3006 domain-containing protein n=1 Tax=Natrinema limicola JCM 13563 TaxID=1230457 RepID=M0CET8_9EURY|nr:DUF3006 domain-containing protein [Natrinema limicola]ELZ20877.1 hypothetical protein C476_09588 [Natrinema limicola JCM 13563]